MVTCNKCNDTGIAKEYYRREGERGKPKVTYIVWELCDCERGKKLPELWEKYPAWRGAPYEFFEVVG